MQWAQITLTITWLLLILFGLEVSAKRVIYATLSPVSFPHWAPSLNRWVRTQCEIFNPSTRGQTVSIVIYRNLNASYGEMSPASDGTITWRENVVLQPNDSQLLRWDTNGQVPNASIKAIQVSIAEARGFIMGSCFAHQCEGSGCGERTYEVQLNGGRPF